jgi:hypothetical protein
LGDLYIPENGRESADVVGVGVRDEDEIDIVDAKAAQTGHDEPFAGIGIGRLWAGVDEDGATLGLEHRAVALANGQKCESPGL